VSRCGISYVSSQAVGWKSILESWLNTLPQVLKEYNATIAQLFERFCPPLFNMHRQGIFRVTKLDIVKLKKLVVLIKIFSPSFRSSSAIC